MEIKVLCVQVMGYTYVIILEEVCTREQEEYSDMKYLKVCWHICLIDLLVANAKVANNDESIIIMTFWSKWIIHWSIVLTVKVAKSEIMFAVKVFISVCKCVCE